MVSRMSYCISRRLCGFHLGIGLVRLSWAEAMELPQADLEARLFPEWRSGPQIERPMLDCEHIYEELRTHMDVNLTLSQLWLEYKEQHPDGYQYTQFCQF